MRLIVGARAGRVHELCSVSGVFQFRVAVDVALNVTSCSASSVPITTQPYGGSSLDSSLSIQFAHRDGESQQKTGERRRNDIHIPQKSGINMH